MSSKRLDEAKKNTQKNTAGPSRRVTVEDVEDINDDKTREIKGGLKPRPNRERAVEKSAEVSDVSDVKDLEEFEVKKEQSKRVNKCSHGKFNTADEAEVKDGEKSDGGPDAPISKRQLKKLMKQLKVMSKAKSKEPLSGDMEELVDQVTEVFRSASKAKTEGKPRQTSMKPSEQSGRHTHLGKAFLEMELESSDGSSESDSSDSDESGSEMDHLSLLNRPMDPAATSEYLKGDAYKFYMNNVSWELKNWKYQKFMKSLFNACFPATFRQERLDTLKQEDRTVRKFESELKLLYRVVGKARKRERVRKLWRGLQPQIQQKLYAGYDYETSLWGQVVAAAEMFEIARTIGMDTKKSSKESRKDSRDRGNQVNKRNNTHPDVKEDHRDDGHRRKSSRGSWHFG
ncbi:hypothetical protein H0H93_010705 [Arthromyces matolae]|nr:hypothetical protein H0H93_010705 [Arthromyces matolae]